MATIISFENRFEMPLGVGSLAEFRRWMHAPTFPTQGRIDYLSDRIEVDLSPENLFCHGTVKTEIASVLHQLSRQMSLGEVFIDSTRVVAPAIELSVEPDVVFITYDAIHTGRVRFVSGANPAADQYVEIEGSPNLLVEIVSDSSVGKDLRRLPPLYFAAGVSEFWLADARRDDQLMFEIQIRGDGRFISQAIDSDGFQFSPTFNRHFRLDRSRSRVNTWRFDLVTK